MKGPSGRMQYRIVRTWRCPRCGATVATPGSITTLACPKCPSDAQGNPPWMVVEDPKKRTPHFGPLDG